ncbi:surfeit locus protein 2-like [Rhopilema esculentum]|uniref:surfeit locus protein 2-like n=1 Tax=Rhopilema esculentum TaxID=499914 RepID=UPI0031D26499
MDKSLQNFLDSHTGFRLKNDKTRVVCSITGHELPCNLNALECYVNSKKYKQFTKNGTCDLSKVEEFKEYLIPSKKGQNKLFCLITKKEINNIPSHIENHVTGRKFQRDLKIYKKKLEGVEESSDQGQSRSKFYNEEKPPTVAEEEEESDDAMMMEERIEKQDEEFLGGIWVPKGKITEDQVASCEESMDMDMKEECTKDDKQNKKVAKTEKNKLKRKFKQTKREKLVKTMNQKKKK